MFEPHSFSAPGEPPAPEPAPADADAFWSREAADARAAARVGQLRRVAQIGEDLLVELRRLILDGSGDSQLALAYVGIAKAVRQTVALGARLDVDAEGRAAQAAADRAAAERARARATAQAGDERRRTAQRVVETAIEDAVDPELEPEKAEWLYDALHERLADPDDTLGIETRPLSEVLAKICHDLGLSPDWAEWADEDWAQAEAAAREPGSPFLSVCLRRRYGGLPAQRTILRPSWLAARGATGPPG